MAGVKQGLKNLTYPVSKLACDGEGTLRLQGCLLLFSLFIKFPKKFSGFSSWICFAHAYCFWKQNDLQMEIVLFIACVLFLKKQKCIFLFFSISSVNSLIP